MDWRPWKAGEVPAVTGALGAVAQQIPGETSDVSVQKSTVLGTAATLRRTLNLPGLQWRTRAGEERQSPRTHPGEAGGCWMDICNRFDKAGLGDSLQASVLVTHILSSLVVTIRLLFLGHLSNRADYISSQITEGNAEATWPGSNLIDVSCRHAICLQLQIHPTLGFFGGCFAAILQKTDSLHMLYKHVQFFTLHSNRRFTTGWNAIKGLAVICPSQFLYYAKKRSI